MSAHVHLGVGTVSPRPACGAGARWASTEITTVRGTRLVTCLGCTRTKAYREAAA